MPVSENFTTETDEYLPSEFLFDDLPTYQPISRLSDSMAESMRMMADIQRIKASLPGIDCGSCGAPNCRALAEDIVKGQSTIEKCLIRLRDGGVEDEG